MIKHHNGLAFGSIKRQPAPSFAHAILLDQGDDSVEHWYVIDLYGPIGWTATDEQVSDWPVVYEPMDDDEWAV